MDKNILPKEILQKCQDKFGEKYTVSPTYYEHVLKSQWRTVHTVMNDSNHKSSIRVNNLGSFLLKKWRLKRYFHRIMTNRASHRKTC